MKVGWTSSGRRSSAQPALTRLAHPDTAVHKVHSERRGMGLCVVAGRMRTLALRPYGAQEERFSARPLPCAVRRGAACSCTLTLLVMLSELAELQREEGRLVFQSAFFSFTFKTNVSCLQPYFLAGLGRRCVCGCSSLSPAV